MVKALVIPAAEDEQITECEVDRLEDYQAMVGGWIEPVDIPALGVTVYVHEEGLMLYLPFNPRNVPVVVLRTASAPQGRLGLPSPHHCDAGHGTGWASPRT